MGHCDDHHGMIFVKHFDEKVHTRQGMIMMIGSHQLMLVMDTCDINDIL
jgi:hypothetical protein